MVQQNYFKSYSKDWVTYFKQIKFWSVMYLYKMVFEMFRKVILTVFEIS